MIGKGQGTTGVSAVMTPDPEVLHVDHSLVEAAGRMRDLDVGLMFVVDGDQLVGAVTDRDFCCRAVAEGLDPARTTVQRAMTRHIVFCRADDDIDAALEIMQRENIRRLAVLNADDELVGAFSLGDLARAHPQPEAPGEALEEISSPTGTEKTPHAGLPTGGRAVASRKGVPATYRERPRLPRRARVRGSVADGG